MAKQFKHLQVPDQWNNYFTRYPQGYTILEALMNWITHVDNLTDNINDWNKYLDDFTKQFDGELKKTVEKTIKEWQDIGLLDDIIESTLKTGLDKKRDKAVKIQAEDLAPGIIKEVALSEEVKQMMAGNTPIHMEVEDRSITDKKLTEKSILPFHTGFSKTTTNLFDWYTSPEVRGHFSGRQINIAEESANLFTYIPCKPNTIYKIQRKHKTHYLTIGYVTGNITDGTPIEGYRGLNETDHTKLTFKTGDDAKYIVLLYYGANEKVYTPLEIRKALQIEEGSSFTDIKPRTVLDVKDYYLEEQTQINLYNDVGLANQFVKSGDFPEVSPSTYGEVEFSIMEATSADIYDLYDELLDTGYLTKELKGYATNSLGENDHSLPIYEYTIYDPINDIAGVRSDIKNIGIVGGLHGTEKGAVYSLYQFVKQMLENKNDKMNQIFTNTKLQIIPIANPWGFNNYLRRNARDVDLNRNFSFKWEENTSSFKGSEPYSELESKLLRQWVQENEFDFIIDFHNTRLLNAVYLISSNEPVRYIFTEFVKGMRFFWKETYDIDPSKTEHHITNWLEGTPGTFAKEAELIKEKPISCILEATWGADGLRFKKPNIKIGVDLLANLTRGIVYKYNG